MFIFMFMSLCLWFTFVKNRKNYNNLGGVCLGSIFYKIISLKASLNVPNADVSSPRLLCYMKAGNISRIDSA